MNLTVLIGSCDKYSRLWENFQICFDRYWNLDTRNLLTTEYKKVENITDTYIETHNTGNGEWGSRMLEAVNDVDTDFIFWILDDYYLNQSYPDGDIEKHIEDMDNYGFNRLQMSESGLQKYKKIPNTPYHQIVPESNYLISIQPSIWRKSFIQEVLNPTYSPWDFEIKGSRVLNGTETKTAANLKYPHMCFNAVRRGFKKSKGWEEFKAKENLKDF